MEKVDDKQMLKETKIQSREKYIKWKILAKH
jgi:hypothetical protein